MARRVRKQQVERSTSRGVTESKQDSPARSMATDASGDPPQTDTTSKSKNKKLSPVKISYQEFLKILCNFQSLSDEDKHKFSKYFTLKRGSQRKNNDQNEYLLNIGFNSKFVDLKKTNEDNHLFTRGDLSLGFLNWIETSNKRNQVRNRIRDGDDKPCLLMQGDSWFEYPVFLKDISDHLLERYNAYSHSAAGAKLQDMVTNAEYKQAFRTLVTWKRPPKAILVSGGGNDLVGDNFHKLLIKKTAEHDDPLEHLKKENLEKTINVLISYYKNIIGDIEKELNNLKNSNAKLDIPLNFIFHSYGYGIPEPQDVLFDVPPVDGWTGKPLRAAGVRSPKGQAAIIKHIIDAYHDALVALSNEVEARKGPSSVRVVDSRNVVPNVSARQTGAINGVMSWIAQPKAGWNDELHPNDQGFSLVAAKFEAEIAKIPTNT